MEQEADRVADQVMNMTDPLNTSAAVDIAGVAVPEIQRVCADCEDELHRQPEYEEDIENGEALLMKPVDSVSRPSTPPHMESEVKALKAGGEALPDDSRAFFEPRFGHDFSQVRIHRDSRAAKNAASINARAFTVGNHIVFGAGYYAPNVDSGRRLLAHELTHVRQQYSGRAPGGAIIQRQPGRLGGESEDPVHGPAIRQFRREQGIPESGVDPDTGKRIGPMSGQLKYGGVLHAWARSQPGAHFANATRRCENPAVRLAAGPSLGLTTPTINGQVFSNVKHVIAQITPTSLKNSTSGGTTSCRIPTSWRFETSANVITPCPAPKGGRVARFTSERLSQLIGRALPGHARMPAAFG